MATVMRKRLVISQMIKKKTRSYLQASIVGNNFIFILPIVFSECNYASPVILNCYDATFSEIFYQRLSSN